MDALIIFTRYPEAGKAKTRLIPALGPVGAADLHRQMTEHCLREVRQFQAASGHCAQGPNSGLTIEVQFTGATTAQMQAWLGVDLTYCLQAEGDLGDRLAAACHRAFAAGCQSVMIIGTDCPGLNALTLTQARQSLQHHDLVLGPAQDGGYYLIGLRKFVPALFQGIAWSTANTLAETVVIARQHHLNTQYLPPLSDVDHPEDLIHWRKATTKISIIIPTLNEAASIAQALTRLKIAPNIEIILVDGGSHDQTLAIAQTLEDLPIKILSSPPGRAHQMNQGAQVATGEILLFLHADTQLPNRFDLLIRQALTDPQHLGGAFALQIDAQLIGLRLVEWLANWRSRALSMPYGDQGIFIRAEVFHQLGGFPTQPIMEDYELMRRLKQQGKPIVMIAAPALTSGRRWQRLGVVKTTVINQVIVLAYRCGVSPERLARWYRGKKV
jgi:uncharacterized protein